MEKVFYESSYQFRLLQATWGIYALIKAKIEPLCQSETNGEYRISDNVWFSFDGKLTALSEDKKFMLNGIKSVCDEIETQIDQSIVVILTDFQIIPSDYQKEGMFYAFANWATHHFGFPEREFNSRFDKELNKYIFSDLENDLRMTEGNEI